MKYCLLRFTRKRDLRLLLRYNYKQAITRSSLYKIDKFYYVLLQSTQAVSFTVMSQVLVIEHKTVPEEYLFNWAQSEILQTVDYIQFEQNSILCANSRIYDYGGVSICRCFLQLADTFAILNYTPDSFSDGGKFNKVESALIQIEHLCALGADIIDLGVQATNPLTSRLLTANEEINLLGQILPYVLEQKQQLNFELSIDTYHPQTVLWLADFAVDIINDVSGKLPIDIVKSIVNTGRRYVAMHSLAIPANPQVVLTQETNPIEYLYNWWGSKIEMMTRANCDTSNVILDPGIGFGLTGAQSWFVLRHLAKLHEFPCEILVGSSRKSFFKHIGSREQCDLNSAIVAAISCADYVRLHELEHSRQINPVFNQLGI